MRGETLRECAWKPALLAWPAVAVALREMASVPSLCGPASGCTAGVGGVRGRRYNAAAAAGAVSFCQPAMVATAESMDVCQGKTGGEWGELEVTLALRGAEEGVEMVLLVL